MTVTSECYRSDQAGAALRLTGIRLADMADCNGQRKELLLSFCAKMLANVRMTEEILGDRVLYINHYLKDYNLPDHMDSRQ